MPAPGHRGVVTGRGAVALAGAAGYSALSRPSVPVADPLLVTPDAAGLVSISAGGASGPRPAWARPGR